MKTYYADMSGMLLALVEARIKEYHLPVHLQYGVPYEEYDETLMHPITMDYPDDFDLNGELLLPCVDKLILKL